MNHRLKAVLKTILAIVCLLLTLLIVASVISVTITELSDNTNLPHIIGFGVAIVIFLAGGVLLSLAAYRLLKGAKKDRILAPAGQMSSSARMMLVVLCFLGILLSLIMEIGCVSSLLEYYSPTEQDPILSYRPGHSTVFGYWILLVLLIAGTVWLVKISYRLLRHSRKKKEVIELLGEEF